MNLLEQYVTDVKSAEIKSVVYEGTVLTFVELDCTVNCYGHEEVGMQHLQVDQYESVLKNGYYMA